MSPPPSNTEPRIFLHVGSAKTGTTYLQGLLWHHRERLAAAGLHYVAERPGEHFLAALDLRDVPFAGARRPQAAGMWRRVVERARAVDGVAVISHEVFAPAPAEVAARGVADLQPAEVHIVLTARGLLRQVTADWQERIKHGAQLTFAEYVETVLDPEGARAARASGHSLPPFWQAQDAADVLGRWAGTLPAERVHLVTVPPPMAPKDLLWQRFATALGIDPHAYDVQGVSRDNTSLGLAETELLRRVNVALAGRLPMPAYGRVVKDRFAHTLLAGHVGATPMTLPLELYDALADQATETVQTLRERGYHVVGDLADLLPAARGSVAGPHPDSANDTQIAAVGVDAVAGLLLELAAERDRLRTARQQAERAPGESSPEPVSPARRPGRVLRRARAALKGDGS